MENITGEKRTREVVLYDLLVDGNVILTQTDFNILRTKLIEHNGKFSNEIIIRKIIANIPLEGRAKNPGVETTLRDKIEKSLAACFIEKGCNFSSYDFLLDEFGFDKYYTATFENSNEAANIMAEDDFASRMSEHLCGKMDGFLYMESESRTSFNCCSRVRTPDSKYFILFGKDGPLFGVYVTLSGVGHSKVVKK